MGTLGCPSCQADAMRLCETCGIVASRRNVGSGDFLNDKPILRPRSSLAHQHCRVVSEFVTAAGPIDCAASQVDVELVEGDLEASRTHLALQLS
jgi:hypothetical protein